VVLSTAELDSNNGVRDSIRTASWSCRQLSSTATMAYETASEPALGPLTGSSLRSRVAKRLRKLKHCLLLAKGQPTPGALQDERDASAGNGSLDHDDLTNQEGEMVSRGSACLLLVWGGGGRRTMQTCCLYTKYIVVLSPYYPIPKHPYAVEAKAGPELS